MIKLLLELIARDVSSTLLRVRVNEYEYITQYLSV